MLERGRDRFTTLPTSVNNLAKEVDKIGKQLAGANIKELPDPKLHQIISFIKSGIRIIGYCFYYHLVLVTGNSFYLY